MEVSVQCETLIRKVYFVSNSKMKRELEVKKMSKSIRLQKISICAFENYTKEYLITFSKKVSRTPKSIYEILK